MNGQPRKPRPKYQGEPGQPEIEHGSDLEDVAREDELVGSTPHLPAPDLRPEEPSRESDERYER